MRLSSSLLAAALLCSSASASASDFTVPTGFNFESAAAAGPIAGVLDDGRILLSTGVFAADELSVLQPDGTVKLFATGLGSVAGVAQSPITGDIIVGDSFMAPALRVLRDLNMDGDALDAGEHVAFAAQPGALPDGLIPLPFALSFKPGTDELFMTGSTSPTAPMQFVTGVVSRFSGGVENTFATGMGYVASMAWDGDDLYVADLDANTFVGRVMTFTDVSGDGDAMDASESVEFASGLSGANGLVRAKDGSFYLSGVFDVLVGGDFSSCIARILPDTNGDGVQDGYTEAYIDGFVFTGALTLLEGPGGFAPGADGDGRLYVGDFTFPQGNRVIRSAPNATTSINGVIANDAAFQIVVSGDIGAAALSIISLDTAGATLFGIGDLCTGFGGAFKIFPPTIIGPTGSTARKIVIRDQPALVGLEVVIQGLTFQEGRYGIGNAVHAVVAP